MFIEAGSPWENAHVESFNGQFRDGCLNREIFCIRWRGAEVLMERWRQKCTWVRPHSALGHRPPAPEAIEPQPMCA